MLSSVHCLVSSSELISKPYTKRHVLFSVPLQCLVYALPDFYFIFLTFSIYLNYIIIITKSSPISPTPLTFIFQIVFFFLFFLLVTPVTVTLATWSPIAHWCSVYFFSKFLSLFFKLNIFFDDVFSFTNLFFFIV